MTAYRNMMEIFMEQLFDDRTKPFARVSQTRADSERPPDRSTYSTHPCEKAHGDL